MPLPATGYRAEHVPNPGCDSTVLSDEDQRVLALLASGLPNSTVARTLNTSSRTLQRRIRDVCDRLGVHTAVEAVAWAARRQLI